jgi:hemolysin III
VTGSLESFSKPVFRGVSHGLAFFVALPLCVVLGLLAETARATAAAVVFGISVAVMFGASALYHRVAWSPERRRVMRRIDHAGIYGLIAGTYTPFGLLVLDGPWRVGVLAVVWSGAVVAIVIRVTWDDAPRWLAAVIAVGLGWVAVVAFPQLLEGAGLSVVALALAGGLCYTLGAIVYATKRPDPFPLVFGFHEVFHVLVIAAVAFQYTAVVAIVT